MSVIVVLPLLLTRLSVEEIAVWYLFVTLIGLQQIADLGFAPTFVRVIAFAMGGASDLRDFRSSLASTPDGPRWDVIERIWNTMRSVYGRLTLAAAVVFAVAGSAALAHPMAALESPSVGWQAWGLIVFVFAITLQGNYFSAYLQGINQVALVRRWEVLASVGAMLSSVVVLALGGRLLALVVANQAWVLLNVLRNWWLCRTVENGRVRHFVTASADEHVLGSVWGGALRSGLGVAMSRGVLLSSGIVFAQVADAAAVAAYLIAYRVMNILVDFSNAPFYSKLPQLATLRSQGREAEQVAVAERGMRLAYWSFVCGALLLGLSAEGLLDSLGSNSTWVSPFVWAAMSVAFFVERYGAMHIQLYSTTNHIVWHIANGVSGVFYLVISMALLPEIGVLAFPAGVFFGYLGFYSWYGPLHVKRAFAIDFWAFQRRTALGPAAVLVAYAACTLALRGTS